MEHCLGEWLTCVLVVCGVSQVAHDQDDDPSNAAHKTLDTTPKDDKNNGTVSTHTESFSCHMPYTGPMVAPLYCTAPPTHCSFAPPSRSLLTCHPLLLPACVSTGHPCHCPR